MLLEHDLRGCFRFKKTPQRTNNSAMQFAYPGTAPPFLGAPGAFFPMQFLSQSLHQGAVPTTLTSPSVPIPPPALRSFPHGFYRAPAGLPYSPTAAANPFFALGSMGALSPMEQQRMLSAIMAAQAGMTASLADMAGAGKLAVPKAAEVQCNGAEAVANGNAVSNNAA